MQTSTIALTKNASAKAVYKTVWRCFCGVLCEAQNRIAGRAIRAKTMQTNAIALTKNASAKAEAFLVNWWSRGELNPCPKTRLRNFLRVQSVF